MSRRKPPRERTAADRAAAAAERAARRTGTPLPSEEPAGSTPPPEPAAASEPPAALEPAAAPEPPEALEPAAAPEPPAAPEPEAAPEFAAAPEPAAEPEAIAERTPEPVGAAPAAPRSRPTRRPASAGDDLHDEELQIPPPSVSRPVSPPGARARPTGRSVRSPRAAAAARSARSRAVAGRPGGGRAAVRGVLGAVVLLVLIAAAIFAAMLFQPFGGKGDAPATVVIPKGATIGQIGDLLAQKDVVSRGGLFAIRARLAGKGSDIKAGTYHLRHGMSYGAALDALATGPAAPKTLRVTIPEGRARREIAPLVKQAGIKGSYLQASVKHAGFRPSKYRAPRGVKNLEGFLFPATYELKPRGTATDLVGQQLGTFEKQFATVDLRAARKKNLTAYDVLIIASMVEREAQLAKERPLVAAVIYNRLKQGMPLGIDATIRYGTGNWTRPLRQSELQADSAYNTRLNTGLPPTPIGNPGLASIKAAAHPASVSYLYYVVKPGACGQHAFSSTDAKFQQDVKRYNDARDKAGGKSPTTC